MRILVRSTNWLGDSVMTIPALKRIRQADPTAYICVLTRPGLRPLFELSGLVDEILHIEKHQDAFRRARSFLAVLGEVRRRHFDVALLFQNAIEAALLTFLARIPRRVGYQSQGRSMLLTHGLKRRRSRELRHETLDYIVLVDNALGAGGADETDKLVKVESLPEIRASEAHRTAARALLRSRGIGDDERNLVVLNPGATNSEAKRWSESSFARVADLFDGDGARVVLIGSSGEEALAKRIELLAQGRRPINLAGLTDIPTLAGVLSLARIVISNDTGTAHVAAALGIPVLTIFGPTNEFETAPLGRRSEVIRAPGIECERCMLRECPIDHRCMTQITPQQVFSRAKRIT